MLATNEQKAHLSVKRNPDFRALEDTKQDSHRQQ
jgi:hypothetical protein